MVDIYETKDRSYYIQCVGKWWVWIQNPPHWHNTGINEKVWVKESRVVSKLQFLIKTGWDYNNTMKAIVPHD